MAMRWPLTRPSVDVPRHRRLEQMAQQLALAETPVPVLREGGVVGNAVVQIEAAKLAIRQVQMHLFAEPPFRSDAETISQPASIRISSSGSTDGRPVWL